MIAGEKIWVLLQYLPGPPLSPNPLDLPWTGSEVKPPPPYTSQFHRARSVSVPKALVGPIEGRLL